MLLPSHIKEDLQGLVRLAATVTDAHTCALLLPTTLVPATLSPPTLFGNSPRRVSSGQNGNTSSRKRGAIPLKKVLEPALEPKGGSIDLVAIHSCARIAHDCRIQIGSGLLGWVAAQGRPIHLTPFDVNSGAVGIYQENEAIRSLVAVPLVLGLGTPSNAPVGNGVLMCDSLRDDSFTNNDVKVLEQLATFAARLLFWATSATEVTQAERSWDFFKDKTQALGEAIGPSSVELVRIRVESFSELARQRGMSTAVQLTEQFARLAQQALPPHFPIIKLPTGEILVAVDNMMSAFFRQKLQGLAQHLRSSVNPFDIVLDTFSAKLGADGYCDIDETLQQQPTNKKTTPTIGGARA